ncbi:FkbM family methyltransferase [Ramlibacter sp. USB13]|uniref:FkbM family methyltransferase n=1 Tax=Ramlibacter cellulosilyticus TaxID=2764187 RepID=A0A923SD69_9BURK|nr:FkbM family methyltransferase [Ramlibacter cellulosilyticus]MBC5785604.1 FkbM family methyltransferase [Ramlibacter cellulosilyticus]
MSDIQEQLLQQVAELRAEMASLRESVQDIRRLVGPFGVRLADDQLLVQTLYGTKYLVDPHDLIMTPQLVVYRQWEADLSRFFARRVHPDLKFVDIGANFGYFTCLVGAGIGGSGSGRVWAVEPNPKLLKLLRANALINWSMCPIDIHPVALGAAEGVVQLCVPADRAANGSLTRSADGRDDLVDVPLRRLDDLVPAGTAIDLVKLDVEGHEYGVLSGARRVIAESPRLEVVMEWSSRQMIAAGYRPSHMLQLLETLGLEIMRIPEGEGAPEPYPVNVLDDDAYDNVLLKRKG